MMICSCRLDAGHCNEDQSVKDICGRSTLIGHGGDQNGFISYIDVNVEKRTAAKPENCSNF
ncbi:MAG: hypothetical protein KF881_09455 [Acidobacteria bacterium]|nr:hypothetical protein [Acidobacteriota bacterium]